MLTLCPGEYERNVLANIYSPSLITNIRLEHPHFRHQLRQMVQPNCDWRDASCTEAILRGRDLARRQIFFQYVS